MTDVLQEKPHLEYQSSALADEQSPLRELLRMALPTVLQMASYTLMQFIDTWMLAKAVGAAAPAAATNAGGLAFSFLSFGMGTIMIVNTLVSQNYGQKNYTHCGRYLWQGIWFALVYSILLMPLFWLMPRWFRAFGHSHEMYEMESIYARIMIATSVLKLIQTSFGQYTIATNRPNLVLLSSVLAVSVNAVAAYAMLFGKCGLPRMGIRGAAIGQVIGITVEMVTLSIFSLARKSLREKFGALDWRPRLREMKTMLNVGMGSGLQFIAEVLAWSLFQNWVMARLGEAEMEANTFMLRYLLLTFLPAMGIGSAVTALVGRYIGMGRPDLAMHRAHLGFKCAAVYLAITGLSYLVFRRQAIELFTHDPNVIHLGSILMIFAAFYGLFDCMFIVYVGALRGAGDTFVPACVTAGLCWTIMLFGGYWMTRLAPSLSVAGPWSIMSVYGVSLGLFMYFRFQRGKWKTIHLEDTNSVTGFAT